MLKVGIIINSLDRGGAERLIVNSIKFFDIHNVQPSVIVLRSDDSIDEYTDALREHVEIIELSQSRSYYNPIFINDILKLFKQFDVLHIHLFPANLWVAIAKMLSRKSPVLIHTEHGILNDDEKSNSFRRLLTRWVYAKFDTNIGISEGLQNRLLTLLGDEDQVIYIPNGVDIDQLVRTPSHKRDQFIKMQGLPQDSKLLLMTARFHEVKRHKLLFKAMNKLPQNYHLLLLGSDEMPQRLLDLVDNYQLEKRIHLLGFKQDAISYMKMVDFNILASHSEGMSGVVLESMAAGKPFLGSDIPGIRELVPNSSFLFMTEESLIEKILKISDEPSLEKSMREEGLRFSKNFSLQKMVESYCALYRRKMETK